MERENTGSGKLETRVLAAIEAQTDADVSRVTAEISNVSGAVTLVGSIPTLEQQQKVAEAVASTDGVSIVHNHLRVVNEEDPTVTHPPPRRKPQA